METRKAMWFNERKFGIFVHYGLYSQIERGEWTMYQEQIPCEEYQKLAETFDPSKLMPCAWRDRPKKPELVIWFSQQITMKAFACFKRNILSLTVSDTLGGILWRSILTLAGRAI